MELVIKPKSKWWHIDLKELWFYRELFYFLTWRDTKVKYKQTYIGVAWAIFQPFITMVIFSVIFGKFGKVPSDGIPYPIFVYGGLLFWVLFNGGLTSAANSFVNNERIISKIYFPRIILPASAILTNIIDFLFSIIIFAGMLIFYHYTPGLTGLLLAPVLVLLTVFSAFGMGLLIASFNVKFRDIRYVLPFFIQILMFVTPVIYPVSIFPDKYRLLLGLNPMSGIIDTARATLLGTGSIDWALLGVSMASAFVYCALGFVYFKKMERYFADFI